MTTTFVLISVLEVIAVIAVIIGFIFEKKIIAFEEAYEDWIFKKIQPILDVIKRWK